MPFPSQLVNFDTSLFKSARRCEDLDPAMAEHEWPVTFSIGSLGGADKINCG